MAERLELAAHDVPHFGFVFDEQHRARHAGLHDRRRRRSRRFDVRVGEGQKNADGRAFARL